MRSGIGSVVYVVIGIIVASAHHYFAHAGTIKAVLSVLLAIALWPLLLLGINLHIH
ncbi:MAG TPA: hypothetical protein VG388_11065 [Solirubrobacteraceae bacterium]|jgi:hypothetical protein|nr:hypothetical protein [Solirubrobacteraceae bacterium]